MIDSQNTKVVCFGTLGAIATNATSNHYVDTLGWERARILAITAAATATNSSAKWTSMVLKEAKVTSVSSATAISGCTGTTNSTATSAQFVLPAHNDTSVKQIVAFDVNLFDKERYLHLTVQAPTAAYATCSFVAILSRGKTSPNTDAEAGCAQVVYA